MSFSINRMSLHFLVTVLVWSMSVLTMVKAQNLEQVEAKGVGGNRTEALEDALRNAVGQAVGVTVRSTSVVENFILIKDAISTNTKGYISSYEVIEEGPSTVGYGVSVSAKVSLDPLKADIQHLTRQIGGVRFLVMYDTRKSRSSEEEKLYDDAVEGINSFLSQNDYRYIEKSRFVELQQEALGVMQESDSSELSYVQQLGILSGAQFIIFISEVSNENKFGGAFDLRTLSRGKVKVKAYDNCTAEGLGTVTLTSDWKKVLTNDSGPGNTVSETLNEQLPSLLSVFNSYIGKWINGGTPYELRFYSIGSLRDLREMRSKLKEDPKFGGQLEVVSVKNYTRFNCTFKKLPDDLAFDILDYADAIPALQQKKLDIKLMYGRQISFAPQTE